MTKSELVDALSEKLKVPKGKAEQLVDCVFESMEKALRSGDRVEIRGFGSFEMREYKAYEGRNPRTGDAVAVRPKRLPFFKVGKELKERINDSGRPRVLEGGASSAAVGSSDIAEGVPRVKTAAG